MNALVVSNSLVVLELLKIVLDKLNIKAEFVKNAVDVQDFNYDLIFIDDSLNNAKREIDFVKSKLQYKNLILLGNNNKTLVTLSDISIKKPFLPADLEDLINKINGNKKSEPKIKTNVLDPNAIAEIKALMDEEINEDDIKKSCLDLLREKNNLKLKNKKAKKFLKKLCKLQKDELKELLKDAKIKISIEFADE